MSDPSIVFNENPLYSLNSDSSSRSNAFLGKVLAWLWHRVFVGPAIGLPYAVREGLNVADADPKLRELVERSLAAAVRTYEQMRKRGIRVVLAGVALRYECRRTAASKS